MKFYTLFFLLFSNSLIAANNLCEKNGDIYFFNRDTQQFEKEIIFGGEIVKKVYEKKIDWIFKGTTGKIVSGILKLNAKGGEKKVHEFINEYKIKIYDFYPSLGRNHESPKTGYANYFDFFIRTVKAPQRPIIQDPLIIPAFADARYRAFSFIQKEGPIVKNSPQTDPREVIVKFNRFSANRLLGDKESRLRGWDKIFNGGPMVIARLAPVDYHRFHFPVDGKILDVYKVKGDFFPVNKLFVDSSPDILFKNVRVVNIIDSPTFGKLAYIEIGAVGVAKIVHTHPAHPNNDPFFLNFDKKSQNDFLPNSPRGSLMVKRGEEKGYFQFGASTIVLLGEAGKWTPSEDILNQTRNGCEILLNLGQPMAKKSHFSSVIKNKVLPAIKLKN